MMARWARTVGAGNLYSVVVHKPFLVEVVELSDQGILWQARCLAKNDLCNLTPYLGGVRQIEAFRRPLGV